MGLTEDLEEMGNLTEQDPRIGHIPRFSWKLPKRILLGFLGINIAAQTYFHYNFITNFNEAVDNEKIGKYDAAIEDYKQALEGGPLFPVFLAPDNDLMPTYYEAQYNLAKLLMANEDYSEALRHLNRSFGIHDWPEPHALMGEIHSLEERYGKAIADYVQALKLGGDSSIDSVLVDILEKGTAIKLDSASYAGTLEATDREQIRTGRDLDDVLAHLHHCRGRWLMSEERYDDAIEQFDESIRFDPKDDEYYVARADALLRIGEKGTPPTGYVLWAGNWHKDEEVNRGRYDQAAGVVPVDMWTAAIVDLETALEIDSTRELTTHLISLAHMHRGIDHIDWKDTPGTPGDDDYRKAVWDLEKALSYQKKSRGQAFVHLSNAYLKLGQKDKALETLIEALDFDESEYRSHRNVGLWHFNRRHYDDAIPYLEQAHTYAEDSESRKYIESILSDTYFEKGRRIESSFVLQRTTKAEARVMQELFRKSLKWEETSMNNYGMAYTYWKLDNNEAALRYNERALELDPDNERALKMKGILKIEDGSVIEGVWDYVGGVLESIF